MPIYDENNILIREVWDNNLEDEFRLISEHIVDNYRYVGMDTEYPGVVIRNEENPRHYNYQLLKQNMDVLKLIQLGLTFADDKGNLPTCGTGKYCLWQFNFCEFDPDKDRCAKDSIELLKNSGIDFKKNKEKGVTAFRFGELLTSSGVVMNDEVTWITFHGAYDFAFLVKVLRGEQFPDTEADFYNLIEAYFNVLYDVKYLVRFCDFRFRHGGLNRIAATLGVRRVGTSHQAGSDSLLTSCTFKKLIEDEFQDSIPTERAGVVIGVNSYH